MERVPVAYQRESSTELWASFSDNYSRCPMVFPDLLKEEESCAFSIDGGVHRDEVHVLG
jgi:hypothetical protein